MVPPQNTVDGVAGQVDVVILGQHHLQLARTIVGKLAAQGDYQLLEIVAGLSRTVQRLARLVALVLGAPWAALARGDLHATSGSTTT